MTDFQIAPVGNGDHDLVVTDSDFVIVGRTEDTWATELQQRIYYALGTWHSESAWDRSAGFPWLEGVFGNQPIDGISALIYQRIVEIDGVEGIEGQPVITLDTTTRSLSITCSVVGKGFIVPISAQISGAQ